MNKVEFLLRCRSDFEFFCERMLGFASDGSVIKMKPYQIKWWALAQSYERLVIEAAAGFAKCLPESTKVKTDSGYKTISELSTNDTVFSLDYNYKLNPSKVKAIVSNGIKPIYEITTRTGRKLRCTSNHPIKTIDGWKDIDNGLAVGEHVGVVRKLENIKTKKIEPHVLIILAYMITEGSCTKNGIRFTNKDLKVVDDFDKSLQLYNGKKLVHYIAKNGPSYDYGVGGLIPLLKKYKLFNKTSHYKEIPKEIFELDMNSISLFLNRMWEADGTICMSGGGIKYPHIEYCSASLKLAQGVQSLLLYLGINSKLAKQEARGFVSYKVMVESQESLIRFIDKVGTFNKHSKFQKVVDYLKSRKSNPNYDTIPINGIFERLNNDPNYFRREFNFRVEKDKNMSRDKLSKLAELDNNEELKKLSSSDVYWDIITDIKFIKNEETYDIEVDAETHNFIADDFIVHNSETMGAMYPLWLMFSKRNLRILLVSKTGDQAKGNLLARIKNYIYDNEFLKELFIPKDAVTSWNQKEVITKQGHWVRVVPYNTNIRGYRAHVIICDEADDYDDPSIYFEHVVSRLFEGGKIILISTPTGSTKLLGQLKEKAAMGKMKNYHFIKTRGLVKPDGSPAYTCKPEDVTKEMLMDCVSIWPEGYSKRTLLDEWDEQGRWHFMRNVLCETIGEADDAIFKINDIMGAYDYSLGFTEEVDEEAQYFIGADFAISTGPRADFDANMVIKKKDDQMTLVYGEYHKGWQRPAKVENLRKLYERYDTTLGCIIVADESNMGTMVMNDLRAKGVTVVAQSFHSAARKKLLLTLSNVFQGKSLVIPRSIEDKAAHEISELVKDQLIGFRRRTSDKTGAEAIQSMAPHDDTAISLAMAVQEATLHDEMGLEPVW